MVYPNLGDQIRILRKKLGMSQSQLARRAKTTQQAIALLELGKVNPRITTVRKIAEGLLCYLKLDLSPKLPIEKLRKNQALQKAELFVGLSAGSSALENQAPSKKVRQNAVRKASHRLLRKDKRYLWE